ncbi:MAG TPA: lytic transglycosylase domain-containing protein [Pyrinomonadaceae bacterium]|nr:lytic transglycosylase domain-containing protein [Pyrinomonadaceae bacterium]
MRKRITNPIALVLLLFAGFPLAATAQEKHLVSRSSLARMDVLSRARLFEATIEKAANSEGVDPLILWTIAYNETRFRPWLTSPKNAQGLMQFMPGTAARFGLTNPYEPTSSLYAAAKYVKYLGRLFDWRLESVLAAYNAGEGTVSAYLYGRNLKSNGRIINASQLSTVNGVPPYKETLGYVSQGVKVYRWLKQQGRFATPPTPFVAEKYPRSEKEIKATEGQECKAILVFYDPRTGRRSLISRETSEEPQQLSFGPVIVGQDIPKNSTRRARSTFAGEIVLSTLDR